MIRLGPIVILTDDQYRNLRAPADMWGRALAQEQVAHLETAEHVVELANAVDILGAHTRELEELVEVERERADAAAAWQAHEERKGRG